MDWPMVRSLLVDRVFLFSFLGLEFLCEKLQSSLTDVQDINIQITNCGHRDIITTYNSFIRVSSFFF